MKINTIQSLGQSLGKKRAAFQIANETRSNRFSFGGFEIFAAASLLVLGASFRLMPHPANISPVIAVALFGGAVFPNRKSGIALALSILFLTDCILGFHDQMLSVYGATALVALIGGMLRGRRSFEQTTLAALASSGLFFLITNVSVWASGKIYARSWQGLGDCFVAAVPFAQRSVLGDLLFTGILFVSWSIIQKGLPQLKLARAGNSDGR